MKAPLSISRETARRLWLQATRLDSRAPFGDGPGATRLAVEHLGYVQIDTINVVERAHHHILFSRIPGYRRADLAHAQSTDKSVFEYWTHALAYVPTRDIRHFLPDMKRHAENPSQWFAAASPDDLRKLIARIRRDGPLSIRDIDDDPVEKDHPWASRKPSKRVLQLGFFNGQLAISAREGMVKSYELLDRHFGWAQRPRPATPKQVTEYLLDRALRSQGVVTLDSICHLNAKAKPAIRELLERRVRARRLRQVAIEGMRDAAWVPQHLLDELPTDAPPLCHILSPFDPLIIQRRRLSALFGYDHVFEAYVKAENRRFGYFTLPVLWGDRIVAALDLKTDRANDRLLIQAWHWIDAADRALLRPIIEAELDRFERFQLARDEASAASSPVS